MNFYSKDKEQIGGKHIFEWEWVIFTLFGVGFTFLGGKCYSFGVIFTLFWVNGNSLGFFPLFLLHREWCSFDEGTVQTHDWWGVVILKGRG